MPTHTLVDYSGVAAKTTTLLELGQKYGVHDLRLAINAYIDTTLDLLAGLDDAALTFEPKDEKANDPYAPEADQDIAWSLAHLVLHVTASLEEGSAYASLVARGVVIPQGIRLRYEPDWRDVTTRAQVIERLEESRRMCLAYLDTWPNAPHLETLRDLSERGKAFWGDLNAPATLLSSLRHWNDHLAQMQDARAQAVAAGASAG